MPCRWKLRWSQGPEREKKYNLERQGYQVTAHSYIFSLIDIRHPPESDSVNKLVFWNASGIQILDSLYWLNLHKHVWEYSELLHDNVMDKVKQLMFNLFRKESGRSQIDYLTKDLKMDPTHNVGTFIRLLEWFSETQIFYPTISN